MITPELFESLPVCACEEILSGAHHKDFGRNKRIFWIGDRIEEIFLLTDGRVKITQVSPDGHEIILRLHVPGQFIGPPIPILRGTYTSVAQTVQPCKTLAWSVAEFSEILSRFPQMYDNAQTIFQRQTMELLYRLREIIECKVPQRLASGLLRLRDQIGRQVNDHFELDVSQETLAQMTGMRVATVNRQLSKWEKLGLVTCVRNSIGIRHHVSLSDLCADKFASGGGPEVAVAELVLAAGCFPRAKGQLSTKLSPSS